MKLQAEQWWGWGWGWGELLEPQWGFLPEFTNEGRRRRRVKSHPDSKKKKKSAMESSSGVTEASDGLWEGELGVDAPPAGQNHTASNRLSTARTRDRVSALAFNWNQSSFRSQSPVQTEFSRFERLISSSLSSVSLVFFICPTWDITSSSPVHCRSLKF